MIYMADLYGEEKEKGWWGEDDSISFTLSQCSGENTGPASLHHCLDPPERFILKTFQAKTQAPLARSMDGEVPILCPFSLLFKEELRRTEAGVHSDATPPAEDTAASSPSCLLSPGLSPERGRMTYRFVLTECSSAVWPPNYGRNTQPLALEVSGATRGGAATQLPACTRRGGGGGGEGENSSEPTSSLGLTISANLTGEDKITTEPKRSKQAPASPLLPPSFPPQSLFVVVS